MSKEENGNQDVGATEFDYPNNMNPRPHAPMYYGNQYVPHPTNSAAKVTLADKVMRAINEAK